LHKLSNSVVTHNNCEPSNERNSNLSSSTSNKFTQDHTGHTSNNQYNNTQLSGTVKCRHTTHSADKNSKGESASNLKLWPKHHHLSPLSILG